MRILRPALPFVLSLPKHERGGREIGSLHGPPFDRLRANGIGSERR